MPLGSYKGPWARNATAGRACRVGIDAPHCHPCEAGSSGPQCAGGASSDHYLSDLLGRFPSGVRDSTQVPTAVATYRKALAAAQNHSVAIASIGITTNMRDLVLSERDEFSPLSGPELIGQKVKLIVWMDGGYNFVRATPSFRLSALSDARRLLQGCAGHDGDDWLGSDAACRGSAKLAVEGIPANVRQIFSSVGGEIMHVSPTTPASVAGSAFESACGDCAQRQGGDWLANCSTAANPCRVAQEDWPNGPGKSGNILPGSGRSSWDPITVLLAVRGAAAMHLQETGQGGKSKHMPFDQCDPGLA